MSTPAIALGGAVRKALADLGLPDREPVFERPRQREHGDWSTNVALTLAKPVGRPPRELAQEIVAAVALPQSVESAEIAGPGFINFRLAHAAFEAVVREAVGQGEAYGRSRVAAGQRLDVEFVSANPTGPLHIGAGRWAAVGDAVASLLEATGAHVTREYYFNDAGSQMDAFGDSVTAALQGEAPPENGYHGAYITGIADELRASGDLTNVGEAAYQLMLAQVKGTLERFRVHFDVFFGERSLHASGAIEKAVQLLRERGHVDDAEDAVWLRTTDFGDDKDRVLLRADGRPTYFAADCAYLFNKLERGFDVCFYLLGADHHGYVKRLHAVERALGADGHVEVLIGQLVTFLREGAAVRMSKRSGDYVTFDDLLDEVGVDAARYTLLRTSIDQPLDFDLAEVVKQERENPVYYVQYSCARIAGIMRTATERGVEPGTVDEAQLGRLVDATETELIRRISAFPELVAYAAAERAPHRVARYAEDVAEAFHKFYTDCHVVGPDAELTRARYWLCVASRQTLANALGLLGVSAPERM